MLLLFSSVPWIILCGGFQQLCISLPATVAWLSMSRLLCRFLRYTLYVIMSVLSDFVNGQLEVFRTTGCFTAQFGQSCFAVYLELMMSAATP